jgi:hypothetical protein
MTPTSTVCRPQLPALYGQGETVGWELAPAPFALTLAQTQVLQRLGPVLWRFIQAQDQLYKDSLRGQAPAWIAELLHQGKPQALIQLAQMKRFRSHLPTVIRPDLLITENGFALTEIDSVPGGLGFTAALNQAYADCGFATNTDLPARFGQLLGNDGLTAIVVSDEAGDYRPELTWLSAQVPNTVVCHPRDLNLIRDTLVVTLPDGAEAPIRQIYRFFELFDLPNIPKSDLMVYAIKKGLVTCTPPLKPHLEEKLWLALLHHPVLAPQWDRLLGEADFAWLKSLVPQGWVLDPTPLPPQAVIPGWEFQSFQALANASQKGRQLVIKPSGFSPLAWGSRGVTVGHDVSGAVWQETLTHALDSFAQTPHILQRFEKPMAHTVERLRGDDVVPLSVRTRLCPYYFALGGEAPEWVGTLATHCPADKKVIHGMKDAILAPVVF